MQGAAAPEARSWPAPAALPPPAAQLTPAATAAVCPTLGTIPSQAAHAEGVVDVSGLDVDADGVAPGR